MRLLNVRTRTLHTFHGTEIPHYAILSHRWEDGEVTFQDLLEGGAPEMTGWSKIEGCCNQAIKDHLQYAWIDSCCIDKSSSAELSEAINSMFRWYNDAEVCYAYLSDVTGSQINFVNGSGFGNSKWFTRGWTLQELLAPVQLVFFDGLWSNIGSKDSLQELVKSVTGIQHLFNFEEASVAQKMSWASRRETTRIEDTAYCLMGLFGVNMPPLYGEGNAAFLRLQLEIMKISNDESIFAWEDATLKKSGLLAPSPSSFKNSFNIKRLDIDYVKRPPYSMTNKGLQIDVCNLKLHWLPLGGGYSQNFPINCAREGQESSILAPILSCKSHSTYEFERIMCERLVTEGRLTRNFQFQSSKTVYVQQPHDLSTSGVRSGQCSLEMDFQELLERGFQIYERHLVVPELGYWGKSIKNRLTLRLASTVALVVFKSDTETLFLRISAQENSVQLRLFATNLEDEKFLPVNGLLQDPPIISLLMTVSVDEFTIVGRTQIRTVLLLRDATVEAVIQKTATHRQLFGIKLSIVNLQYLAKSYRASGSIRGDMG